MFNEEYITKMNAMFTNPLFKIGFTDFFTKMQKEGIEAARRYWSMYAAKNSLFPNSLEMYERMADFYIILGFVTKTRYDDVLRENQGLKEENKFLKEVIQELQTGFFKEGGEKAREIWQGSVDKQLEANKEISKNFFELFRMLKVGNE